MLIRNWHVKRKLRFDMSKRNYDSTYINMCACMRAACARARARVCVCDCVWGVICRLNVWTNSHYEENEMEIRQKIAYTIQKNCIIYCKKICIIKSDCRWVETWTSNGLYAWIMQDYSMSRIEANENRYKRIKLSLNISLNT